MKTGWIITPLATREDLRWVAGQSADVVLCADGGLAAARRMGITPHCTLGDFDSMPLPPPSEPSLCFPSHKDETDSLLCLQEGLRRGCEAFTVLGGVGGRLDHSMANLQLLSYALDRGARMSLTGGDTLVTMLPPGEHVLKGYKDAYLSFFAYTPVVYGLTLCGVAYPLESHTLDYSFPLCVSNRFVDSEAFVSFTEGRLLAITVRFDSVCSGTYTV